MRGVRLCTAALVVAALSMAQTAAPPPPASVAGIAAKAAAAREANQVGDALRLYRQAVRIAPRWEEGWWQIGTLHYSMDQYPQCVEAFKRFTKLNPKMSFGFAFLGLCEYQLKDYGTSLRHLENAFRLGLPNKEQLTDVVIYHMALLNTRGGDFERALRLCSMLAHTKGIQPDVIALAGVAALRRPIFPSELHAEDRALVFKMGNAFLGAGGQTAAEYVKQFEELTKEFPAAPNVQYMYATVLLANDPDKGVDALKKELEISGEHVPSLISLAFEYLVRGDATAARPYAERAAKAAPDNFTTHACLGRVLLESGAPMLPAAIRELEWAAKLAPDSPQVFLSLASAYAKADRRMEAAKARAEFSRLKKLADASALPEPR